MGTWLVISSDPFPSDRRQSPAGPVAAQRSAAQVPRLFISRPSPRAVGEQAWGPAVEDGEPITAGFMGSVRTPAKDGFVANFQGPTRVPKDPLALSCQRIELPSRTHLACRLQLTFPNHVHEFDAGKRHRG
jgi:hypothetical protein